MQNAGIITLRYNFLQRVDLTKDPAMFFNHLQYPVFLQHAVYARYVMGYYPDGVGISPSNTHIHKYPEGVTGEWDSSSLIEPRPEKTCPGLAFVFRG